MEVWRDIPKYEGLYQISDKGRIKSKLGNNTGGRILKQSKNKKGYLRVCLYRDRKKKSHSVHRMVLTAFVGSCPKYMQCRHLDGNPENNNRFNLEWNTSTINNKDKVKHGTNKHSEKSKLNMSNSKLGCKNHMFGKHHSEKTKKRLRNVNTGKKLSEETKAKMSISHIGKKLSEESIIKRTATRKGLKCTKETREKMSFSQKGKKLSKETKEKISKSIKEYHKRR